ncbi:hypothetical protein E2C01_059147 [Portunus trituberculatus]|uniref:Nucleic-acid-binding protein from mobile element jockey n=1 Tax=Portunus trituberculatus TaxID=210409 RepID=A0A5B7H4L3_PORTR|nr:hypothetical protein [Portunus trituberculatus]
MFLSCDEARLALEHVASLPLVGSGFKTELLHSCNVADSDTDYIPNLFHHHLENSVPEVHRNFIHASRYLAKEISTIPEGNLKKYGKGVLVRAKDITQARMLKHLPCPNDSMFEIVKTQPTFNYSKGCVYSQDLFEFPEEEILATCPSSGHKVAKIRNSSIMVLLTFFGSTLPDPVHIGPINIRVRHFVSHPLQCFSCYVYGHGKSSCKEASRCGNCSAPDSHSEEHCNAAAYCFHCCDAHQVCFRQCPRYRLEQDILQLANSQFISLGSARRELLYRQKDGTGTTSYASLATRSSAESAGPKTTPSATSRSAGAGGPVCLANRFAFLSDDSVESSERCDGNPPDMTKVTHVVDVHFSPVSPKPLKSLTKQHCGSTESIDLAQPKQSKVSPGAHDRESFRDCSAMVVRLG